MRGISPRKLIGVWCVLMISLPIAIVWTRPDFIASRPLPAVLKLAVVIGATSLAGTGFVYGTTRRWSKYAQSLERFAAAIPTQTLDLPDDGPAELESLSRALQALAERVRAVVQDAKIESTRREAILAGMAEGVLAVDRDLRVTFCNEAFAEAFGT